MMRHIVLVKVRADVPAAEVDAVFGALAALRDAIPGIVSFASGADASPESMARGYTHGFVMDFADETARDAYLPHPAHQAAAGRLVGIVEGGPAGVLVMDLPLG